MIGESSLFDIMDRSAQLVGALLHMHICIPRQIVLHVGVILISTSFGTWIGAVDLAKMLRGDLEVKGPCDTARPCTLDTSSLFVHQYSYKAEYCFAYR